jgi:nicotinate-nucleotide adenylyltransferase
MESGARIGIIGGSFNPIHIAHLVIADRFVEQQGLAVCLFVPTFQSPFKQHSAGNNPTADQRCSMVQSAIALHPHFRVWRGEVERGGVSYTIDTILALLEEWKGAEISLLIGADQAVEFVRWHKYLDILHLVQLCIARRPFQLTPEQEVRLTEQLSVGAKKPVWIDAPLLEISSTDIRNRLRHNSTINFLTPKAVRDLIAELGLYT